MKKVLKLIRRLNIVRQQFSKIDSMQSLSKSSRLFCRNRPILKVLCRSQNSESNFSKQEQTGGLPLPVFIRYHKA
jgi:hypothetical protein